MIAMFRPRMGLSLCALVSMAVLAGCSEQGGGEVPLEEFGNTSVGVILDQADRLDAQQRDLAAIADAMTEQAQQLREEGDDLHRKGEDMQFRAEKLEEQATHLRTMLAETTDTIAGVRNAATTIHAILNDEPVTAPQARPANSRGEMLFYGAIVVVLALVLLRIRRRRAEREEEERLNAIRRQQQAYSPTPPAAGSTAGETETAAEPETATDSPDEGDDDNG